ncbi:uncharacterized protein G2W53_001256 [Senna tora]|uniref:Uncharacterized protein n=1 Tax=Senna tora TaxID=362788 RepID=A0A835CK61_9FABA|nr:uncharacterized protein G2W53_001256 [Senna tora]
MLTSTINVHIAYDSSKWKSNVTHRSPLCSHLEVKRLPDVYRDKDSTSRALWAKSINKSSDRYPLFFLDFTSEHKFIKVGHVISHIRNLLEVKQLTCGAWEDHAPGNLPACDSSSGDRTLEIGRYGGSGSFGVGTSRVW